MISLSLIQLLIHFWRDRSDTVSHPIQYYTLRFETCCWNLIGLDSYCYLPSARLVNIQYIQALYISPIQSLYKILILIIRKQILTGYSTYTVQYVHSTAATACECEGCRNDPRITDDEGCGQSCIVYCKQ